MMLVSLQVAVAQVLGSLGYIFVPGMLYVKDSPAILQMKVS